MKKRMLLPLVGIAIFTYILLNMDLPAAYGIMLRTDVTILSVAVLLTVPIVLLKALKWQVLLRAYGADYPLGKTSLAWLVGYAAGLVTPGRLGDMYKAYYLRGRLSMGSSLTTIVADRIIDTIILLSMAFTAAVFLLSAQTVFADVLVTVAAISALFIATVFLASKRRLAAFILRPVFRAAVPQKHKPKVSTIFNDFYASMREMKRKKTAASFSTVLGIAAMLIAILQYYVLCLSLGIGVSFHFLLAAVPIVILLEALPISFSGIGARDAALVFFFAMVGLSAEQAVTLSLLMLLVGYALLGVIGMAIWTRFPPQKREHPS